MERTQSAEGKERNLTPNPPDVHVTCFISTGWLHVNIQSRMGHLGGKHHELDKGKKEGEAQIPPRNRHQFRNMVFVH